jgi:hypothetical protein
MAASIAAGMGPHGAQFGIATMRPRQPCGAGLLFALTTNPDRPNFAPGWRSFENAASEWINHSGGTCPWL